MYMVMIGGTSYTVYGMEVAYEAYIRGERSFEEVSADYR